MDDNTDLARIAALLAADELPRYLVSSYRRDGDVLDEVATVEVSTADAALEVGQSMAERHPTVIVFRETTDSMGIIRSAVVQTFGQDMEEASTPRP